jgi:pimeloyl-ACP methyl ester carboxylesterase
VTLEVVTTGQGKPVTLFVHGATGSIATTRPFGSGVRGSRVFVHLPGYGASPPIGQPSFDAVVNVVARAATDASVTQAFGVSLGAAIVARLLLDQPGLLRRAVLALPAGLAHPSPRLTEIADALDDGRGTDLLVAESGAEPSSELRRWSAEQTSALASWPVGPTLRGLAKDTAVADPRRLVEVAVPVLVIAQEGDPAHPDTLARHVADRLPQATLEVLPPGGLLWAHRARVRDLVSNFLAPGGEHA